MSDVEMPEELDIDREDLSLSNEIVESDEDNREAIVYGDGRVSESRSCSTALSINLAISMECTARCNEQMQRPETRRAYHNRIRSERELKLQLKPKMQCVLLLWVFTVAQRVPSRRDVGSIINGRTGALRKLECKS
ncbi:hypothetical protein ACLKA7_014921 [Drosophila subpalustris]